MILNAKSWLFSFLIPVHQQLYEPLYRFFVFEIFCENLCRLGDKNANQCNFIMTLIILFDKA